MVNASNEEILRRLAEIDFARQMVGDIGSVPVEEARGLAGGFEQPVAQMLAPAPMPPEMEPLAEAPSLRNRIRRGVIRGIQGLAGAPVRPQAPFQMPSDDDVRAMMEDPVIGEYRRRLWAASLGQDVLPPVAQMAEAQRQSQPFTPEQAEAFARVQGAASRGEEINHQDAIILAGHPLGIRALTELGARGVSVSGGVLGARERGAQARETGEKRYGFEEKMIRLRAELKKDAMDAATAWRVAYFNNKNRLEKTKALLNFIEKTGIVKVPFGISYAKALPDDPQKREEAIAKRRQAIADNADKIGTYLMELGIPADILPTLFADLAEAAGKELSESSSDVPKVKKGAPSTEEILESLLK